MKKGILLDSDNDLLIIPQRNAAGEIIRGLVVDNNLQQCARLIMEANKGESKEHPTLGFGIARFVKNQAGANAQRFVRDLTVELESDGLKSKITVSRDLKTVNVDIIDNQL